MAIVLHECTRDEQRAVVRFLWAKGLSTEDVHREMRPVYGDNCFSRKAVYNWIQEFSKGRQSIRDRERPGRPPEVSTEATVQRVEQTIRNDRRVTIDDVARAVGCSHGTAHNIMHERLRFRKVCARWVPRQLTEEHKLCRMGLSLQHLTRYTEEGDDFLARIVTGDESWVHHFQPESKRSSMEWKHPTSPTRRKFRTIPSARKVMLTVFWDMHGVILQKFQPHGVTVTAMSYCTTLRELRQAIRRKRPGLLTKGVLLLDDNARPHTAGATRELLRAFRWDRLEHPPYSPDLAPSDFHLFGPLKNHLGGRHFGTDDAVTQEVTRWLRRQPKDFFAAGFQGLVKRWDKCLNVQGDYVEK